MKTAMRILLILVAFLLLMLSTASAGAQQECVDTDGPYIDFYCDHWGNRVPFYINNDSWMIGMPEHVSGKMAFYGIYSMDATARFRGIDYEEMGCPMGGISLMSPIDIGQLAYIKVDNEWYGPFCVVDCAKRGDMYSIVVYRDEVVEVNFEFAETLGMVERRGDSYIVREWYKYAEVYVPSANHPLQFPTRSPINFDEYWLERAKSINHYESPVFQVEGGWKVKGEDIYYLVEYNQVVKSDNYSFSNNKTLFYLE